MKNRILVGALVAGTLMFGAGAAAPAMAADNLIVNGTFAEPAGTVSSRYEAGTTIPGWSIDSANGFNLGTGLYIERLVEGSWTSGHVSGQISQSFPTEVGKTYTVDYALFAGLSNQNPIPVGDVPLAVSVTTAGQVIAEQNLKSPVAGSSTAQSFSFTATGTTTKISFANPYMAVGLDNISVTAVPVNDSPLMIPAIAGGLGIAALGASGIAIQRKKKLAGE